MSTIQRILTIVLAGAYALASVGDTRASGASGNNLSYESERNSDLVLYNLSTVLGKFKLSGRIYFVGTCDTNDRYFPPTFPRIKLRPNSNSAVGIAAVRDMFGDDQNIDVTGDGAGGIVRIWIGRVSKGLLDTGISTVHFEPAEQYNAILAVKVIENAVEVQIAMRDLGLREVPLPSDGRLLQPAADLPHLPPYLRNMTLGRALDVVATVFGGIVMYGECGEPKIVNISFSR